MTSLLVALGAGLLIGLSLGALGAGGSILAVPVLVHLLGQSPAAATTGSLVVVGVSALVGAVTAARAGRVMVARGITFALVATGGSVVGALASAHVADDVLMLAFAALMLVVGGLMLLRLRRPAATDDDEPAFAEPILTISPTFSWDWPRAAKVLLAATVTGLLTGFLGVGGGFLVVPALVLALGLPMRFAAGTSLVVIAITSAVALSVRTGVGAHPDWTLVAVLTGAAALASMFGSRVADRLDPALLTRTFTGVVLLVGTFTAAQALAAF